MEKTSVFVGEKLLEIEANCGLFDLTVENLHLWQYVRYNCLLKILEEITGIKMICKNNRPFYDKSEKKFVFKEWIRKWQFCVHKKDLIVINVPRRVKEGIYYKCVITDTILENLDYSYYVYENKYMGMHFNPVKTKNLKYISMDGLKKKKKYSKPNCDKSLKEFMVKIIETFEEECETKFSRGLRDYIAAYIKNVFCDIWYYKIWAARVMALVRPKAVMVTVGYDPFVQVVIAEAKKRNIPTIELEHGRIGATHLAYNYIYKGSLDVFADYMFVYGDYEKNIPRYPIDRKNVMAVGYAELEKKASLYAPKKRKQYIITFISGTLDGEILSQYAVDLRKSYMLRNVRMIYKLHPSEYNQWKRLYPVLIGSGLEIISENKHDIYYYIGNSNCVIGISSTVLFEATMFNTKIFIIKERDYRKAEALYQSNMAELVTSEKELSEKIVNDLMHSEDVQLATKMFFKRNSIKNIKSALKKIILS